MAVTNGWGQGVINNTNGFGKLATNNIGAGSVYENSASGDTVLVAPSAPSFASTRSFNFDGVDDFIQIPYNSIFNQSVYSFSFWIKNDSNSTGGDKGIICADTSTRGFAIQQNSQVLKFTPNISSGASTVSDSDFFNTTSTWIHCALTFDGTDLILYKNGVSAATQSSGTLTLNANNNNLTIGNNPFTSGRFFDGNIDEVSIFNTALSSSDVTSIYNSGVPNDISSLNPVAWYRCGENASYKSPQWLMPENSNFANSRFSNYSFEFDGVDDFFIISPSISLSGTFTLSAWVKPVTLSSNQGNIISSATSNANKIGISSPSSVQVKLNGTLSTITDGGSNNFTIGTWQHILIIRNSSNTVTVFRNGSAFGSSVTNAGTGTFDSIGKFNNVQFLDEQLDEVAIFDTDQSANVANIYNGGVPTTLPSGAVAHWRMGEEANFTNNWLINNSALSNYSTRSFQFDGVDDFINCGDNDNLSFGDGSSDSAFSISSWWNMADVVSFRAINKVGTSISEYRINTLNSGLLKFTLYDNTNSNYIGLVSNSDLSSFENTWINVVATYDGSGSSSGLKVYVNGSILATSTNNSGSYVAMHNTSNNFLIGKSSFSGVTSTANGKIDEVAVFNSELSASDVTSIYNSGTPSDISSLSPISHWRMGENATFSTNWSLPDNGSASNTGTSSNMDLSDLVGDAPNYTGAGLSNNMTIEDRVGNAANSDNNAVSFNMTESDRETDVPS